MACPPPPPHTHTSTPLPRKQYTAATKLQPTTQRRGPAIIRTSNKHNIHGYMCMGSGSRTSWCHGWPGKAPCPHVDPAAMATRLRVLACTHKWPQGPPNPCPPQTAFQPLAGGGHMHGMPVLPSADLHHGHGQRERTGTRGVTERRGCWACLHHPGSAGTGTACNPGT